MTAAQVRKQAVDAFECPICGAARGRRCRVLDYEWTGKRRMWKNAPLHPERQMLAERQALREAWQ
jgi:hypothetical protein